MRSTTVLALAAAAAPVVLAAPLPLAARDTEFLNNLVARKAGGGGHTNWGHVAEIANNVAGAVDSATNTALNIYSAAKNHKREEFEELVARELYNELEARRAGGTNWGKVAEIANNVAGAVDSATSTGLNIYNAVKNHKRDELEDLAARELYSELEARRAGGTNWGKVAEIANNVAGAVDSATSTGLNIYNAVKNHKREELDELFAREIYSELEARKAGGGGTNWGRVAEIANNVAGAVDSATSTGLNIYNAVKNHKREELDELVAREIYSELEARKAGGGGTNWGKVAEIANNVAGAVDSATSTGLNIYSAIKNHKREEFEELVARELYSELEARRAGGTNWGKVAEIANNVAGAVDSATSTGLNIYNAVKNHKREDVEDLVARELYSELEARRAGGTNWGKVAEIANNVAGAVDAATNTGINIAHAVKGREDMEELVARKTNWGNVAETMNNVAGAVDSATNTAINIYRAAKHRREDLEELVARELYSELEARRAGGTNWGKVAEIANNVAGAVDAATNTGINIAHAVKGREDLEDLVARELYNELEARKTNWGNVAETMNNVAGAVDSATNTAINIYRAAKHRREASLNDLL